MKTSSRALRPGLAVLIGFFYASGLAVGDTFFVSNYDSNTIEEYSSTGVDLGVFASTGLSQPQGMAFDSSGNLYVANWGSNTIEKFSPTGANLGVFASTGLNDPCGIAFDSSGNLYAANWGSSTIEKFSPTGTDLGVFVSSGLDQPAGIGFDSSGNLYAVNWGNATVEKFAASGGAGSVFASSAGLYHPAGLAFDSGGNLYVASYWGTTIEKFSSTGADLGVFASGLAGPDGLAFGSDGSLYEADSGTNTLKKIGVNGSVSVFASSGMNDPDFVVIQAPAIVKPCWAAAVSGSWSNAANWTGGVPNAIGAEAAFTVSTKAALTITLDAPQTVGSLLFGNSAAANVGYTLSGMGSNALTLNNAGNGATITVTNGTHVITAPVLLNDNLTVSNAGSLTISGAIANGSNGPMGITLSGGPLVLAVGNTYSGNTTISSGTLTLAHPLAVQNSTVNLGSGGALCFAAGNTNSTLGGLAGAGGLALATAASEPVTLTVGNNNQSTTYSGNLSGAGGLTKIGGGVLTLTASNSYANGTTIAGGTLRIVNSYALGSGPLLLAGGTLGFAAAPQSIGNGIGIHFVGDGSAISGSAGVAAMSNWNNLSGTTFAGVPLSDNTGAATTANLTVNAAGTWASGSSNQLLNGYIYSVGSQLTAAISGIPYSQYSLYAYMVDSTIGNTEEVTLGGKNYYFGTTNSASYIQATNTTSGSYPTANYVVASGLTGSAQSVTVQGINQPYGAFTGFEIVNTGPTTPPSNAVTLTADAMIDVTGPSSGVITGLLTIGGNRLSLTGGGSGANTAYSLSLGTVGGVSLTGNPTFDVANNGSGSGTLVLGALSDGGTARTITKSDSGMLTLSTAATSMNAGDTVNITGGTLNANNATALGTQTAVNVACGATFALGASQTIAALGDNGTVVVNGASVQLNGHALTVGNGNDLSSTFSGVIADGTGGAGSLVKAGTGNFTIRGSNTYSGGTAIDAGTLQATGTASLPGYATAGKVTVANGGTLALSVGSSGWTSANIGSLLAGNGSGFARGSSLGIDTTAGNFSYGSNISGSMGLTKLGANTLTLTGLNAYVGPTTVNQGSLLVNGSLASPVTVNNGGMLGGSGSLTSVTVASGGSLSPGAAPGAMNVSGSLSLMSGAQMDYALDTPADSDEVYMPSGPLVLSGQQFADFNFTPMAGFGQGTYMLIDAQSISGSLGISTSGTLDGLPANIAIQGNDVVLNVVPEPGTLALLGVGVIGLLGYRARPRRRRAVQASVSLENGTQATLSFPSRLPEATRRAA